MNNIDQLFSRIHDNKQKHGKVYQFTIDKYDCIEDNSAELSLNDVEPDADDYEEEISFESVEDEDDEDDEDEDNNQEKEIHGKIIKDYCDIIKNQMTSTPITTCLLNTPKRLHLNPILNGISPFLRHDKQTFSPKHKHRPQIPQIQPQNQKSMINLLNSVREKNLIVQIKNLALPENSNNENNNNEKEKENEQNPNESVVLCKPNEQYPLNESKINPLKLDFNFDDDDVALCGDGHDLVKDMCQKFIPYEKDTQEVIKNLSIFEDINVSELEPADPEYRLNNMCRIFSQKISEKPIGSPLKSQNINQIPYLTKSSDPDSPDVIPIERNDKLDQIENRENEKEVETNKKKLSKQIFVQAPKRTNESRAICFDMKKFCQDKFKENGPIIVNDSKKKIFVSVSSNQTKTPKKDFMRDFMRKSCQFVKSSAS